MAKLESLIVDLQMNTASMKAGLATANSKLDAFDKRMKAMIGIKSLQESLKAVGAVLETVGRFVFGGVDALDEMGKQAAYTGQTVEEFSKQSYAMRIAGVNADELSKAMVHLGKNMSAAVSGGKDQVALFAALGVKVTDTSGRLRNTSTMLNELADVFNKMPNGLAKSQLGVELFGKGGEKMAESFTGGSARLADLRREAEMLGLVMSGRAAEAAADLNDKIDRLKVIGESAATVLAARLTPSLNSLIDRIMESSTVVGVLKSALLGVSFVLKGIAVIFEAMVRAIEGLRGAMGNIANMAALLFAGQFTGAIGQAKKAIDTFLEAFKKAKGEADKPSKGNGAEDAAAKAGAVTAEMRLRRLERERKKLEEIEKAIQKRKQAIKELEKVASDLQSRVATFDATPFEEMVERVQRGDLAEKLKLAGDQAAALRGKILGAAAALQGLQDAKFEAQRQFDLEMNLAANQRDTREKERELGNIGKSSETITRQTAANSGFTDGQSAFNEFKAASDLYWRATSEAAKSAYEHNDTAERAYLQLAKQAEVSRDNALEGAKAYAELAQLQQDAIRHVGKTIAGFATSFASKLGELGDVIQAGIQGAQQGGWWGAIIAVVLELFSKFEGFAKIVDYANRQLAMVMDMLFGAMGQLTEAFMTFMQFSGSITRIIMQLLAPVLRIFAHVLNNIFKILTPIINTISVALDTIAPILDTLMMVAEALDPFSFAIQAVAGAFNAVSLVIMYIMKGIYELWMKLLQAVKTLMQIFLMDTTEIAATIGKHRVAMDQLDLRIAKTLKDLQDPFAASVEPPLTKLGDEIEDATKKINEFSQSLTNVPDGFRYAAQAYNAQGNGAGDVFEGTGGGNTNITVEGSVLSERELMELIETYRRSESFRRTGYSGGSMLANNR